MENTKLEKIKEIIKPFLKKPNFRSDAELLSISKLIRNIKFFISISEGKNYLTIVNEVAKCLRLEIFEPGENVVNYGEFGDKFYVVLYGKLSVYVPTISSRPGSRSSSRAEIRASILKRNEKQETQVKVQAKQDRQEIEYLKGLVAPGITVNRKDSMKLDINFLTRVGLVDQMNEVSELKVGDSFGELALISDKPRAASIEAKELSIVAVLSKAEFKKVLIQEAEKALKEKINFLENLPVFKGYSRGLVSRLSYYFQEIKYKKGEIVYKARSEANKIYFVNNGEFKLSQNIENKRKQIIFNSLDNSIFSLRANNSRTISRGFEVQCSIKGKNEIIGHEEYISDQKYYKETCICHSNTGILFAITSEDFKTRINILDSLNFLKSITKRDADIQKSLINAEKIVENFSRSSSRNSISRNSSYSDNEIKTKEMLSSFRRKNFKISCFKPQYASSTQRASSVDTSSKAQFIKTQRTNVKAQPILVRKKSFSPIKNENSRLKRLPPPNFMKLSRLAYTSVGRNRREFIFK